MNNILSVSITGLILMLANSLAAQQAIPLSKNRLVAQSVNIEEIPYSGGTAIRLNVEEGHRPAQMGGCDNCTFAWLPDIDFDNGVIELEVSGRPVENAPPWAKGFIGLVFHIDENASSYEGIYLRPVNAIDEDPVFQQRSVQYFSYPDYPWSRLREESPGKYETWADVRPGEWIRLKLVVQGTRAELYINDAEAPALLVTDLKLGSERSGAIGLYTEPATDAWFRNLRFRHD